MGIYSNNRKKINEKESLNRIMGTYLSYLLIFFTPSDLNDLKRKIRWIVNRKVTQP